MPQPDLPEYCCAVIEDARGWLLLQLRPATARHAPDLLTCFGGRREAGETCDRCLVRELTEELDWTPERHAPVCDLWSGRRWIARFSRIAYTAGSLRTEPGHLSLWAPWPALPGLPISPWHRTVFAAITAGAARTEIA